MQVIKRFKKSFFWKIFCGYIIILILALGLISYAINVNYGRFIEKKTIEYNNDILSFIIQSMDRYTLKIDQVIYSIYQPNIFENLFKKDGIDEPYFEKLKRQVETEQFIRQNIFFNELREDISGVVLYKNDQDYFYIGSGGLKDDIRFSDMEWYKRFAQSNSETFISGPVEENYLQFVEKKEDDREKVVLYIKKVNLRKNVYKEKPAFIMFAVKFSKLEEMFQQLLRNDRSSLIVIDSRNEAVYSKNVDPDLEKQLENEIKLLSYPNVKKLKTYDNDAALLTSYFSKGFGWRIVCINYRNAMLSDVKSIVSTVYFILLLGGIVAVVLSIFLSYEIVIPVKNVNSEMKKVEQGNFDVHVSIRSEDEIGQLGRRFNIMVQKIKELIQKVYVAELKEKEAKIEALQAQINPHFLFNTLDNINCIAQIEGVEIIAGLSQSLSKMFRYTIQEGISFVALREEMEHVRNYINIINVRFDNKIAYVDEIDPDIQDYETIRLLLQPIVENAVQHGIARKIRNEGTIVVKGRKFDQHIEITVIDDGVGMRQHELQVLKGTLENNEDAISCFKPKSSGIGLKNVQDRLKLFFGKEWGLSVDSEEMKGTVVTARFPIRGKKPRLK